MKPLSNSPLLAVFCFMSEDYTITGLREFISQLNKDPNPDHVHKNEDGSLYIPISITQTLLDDLFLWHWSFEMLRESYGRKWARGNGKMTVINPITNKEIVRSGDAGILLTGNIRLDSPRLEAMVLLSCAKKFGRVLGRDLNRDKEDAPLPVIQVEKKEPINKEHERWEFILNDCKTYEEVESYRLLIPKNLKKLYNSLLKKLPHENTSGTDTDKAN